MPFDGTNGEAAGPFGLHRDAWGRLVLTDADGRQHAGIEPVRAFPLSDPAGPVAVCDAEGREVAWVESLAAVPAPVRQLLEEELARREFVPVIRRIVSVKPAAEPSEWHVETDRGP